MSDVQHCGYAAIIGAPNAGKSTLLNTLVGSKIAIVTPKVQTTRYKILGIVVKEHTQLILIDTPGIFTPDKRFEKAMVDSAWSGANDADVVLFLVDATRKNESESLAILEKLKTISKPVWLVLNKIDELEKTSLLELAKRWSDRFAFERIMMISALRAKGTSDLIEKLLPLMPKQPWMYPEEDLGTQSMRDIAAEITREKLFLRVHQELPYSLHVETESWEESERLIKIRQIIYTQRESHKKIILGEKGQGIKAIGMGSRLEIEAQTGKKVHLELFIKVRENWKEDREIYSKLGLEYKE
jgi:GTP-binding protein Era